MNLKLIYFHIFIHIYFTRELQNVANCKCYSIAFFLSYKTTFAFLITKLSFY